MINKLYAYLDLLNYKKNFLILILTFAVYSLFEIISIASLIPFLNSFFNPDKLITYPFINWVMIYFSLQDVFNLQIFFGLLFTLFILFSGILGIFTHYLIIKTGKSLAVKIQIHLLNSYLRRNYKFFLERKIDDLKKNIITESIRISDEVFIQVSILLSKFILIFFIFSFLMIVNFKITLFMSITLIFGYFIFFVNIKKFIHKRGKITYNSITGKFNVINNIFYAIKEIKVKNNYKFFTNEISPYLENEKISEIWNHTLSVVPKFIFEQLIFILLILVTLYLYLIQNNDIDFIVSTLGIFAFAGYKLLPAFQAIYVAIHKVRYAKHSLDVIFDDLSTSQEFNERFKNKKISFNKYFEIKVNKFNYKNKNILNNLNLKISKNSFIGITGKSGVGKTTLIDLISLLYPDFDGSIIVDDKKIMIDEFYAFQKNITYITQDPFIFNGTLRKNIILDNKYNKRKYDEIVKLSQLSDITQDEKNFTILENGRSLSGGQKQRICIARALYDNKDILIMDEITSSLDQLNKIIIMKNIKKLKNKTRILISHDKEILNMCNKVIKI